MQKVVRYDRHARRKVRTVVKAHQISRMHKPEHLTLEQWQVALRREFGQTQNFKLKNIGQHPVFSEFIVTNPATERSYRVAIRSERLGDNFCSCPDFSVNTLGTCKHIEFTLGCLRKRPGGRKALSEGFLPSFPEVFLRYGTRRQLYDEDAFFKIVNYDDSHAVHAHGLRQHLSY